MVAVAMTRGPETAIRAKFPLIVGAVSVGTLLEWYGFYLYSGLAGVLTAQFFPGGSEHGVLYGIGIFWTGFAIRPAGAVLFGHLGDSVGRKFALTLAMTTMGGASFVMGCLPGFGSIGWAAPLLLILCRLAQGLAMGGGYGGAATYVAEHAPDGKRGLYTSWIQTTATMGIVLALLVILCCRVGLGDAVFADWAWRVPFWLSAALVGLATYIRLSFEEAPLYARLKEQGKASANPAKESFSGVENWKLMLLALFGATAPEGVVWYTAQFYALFYLSTVLKLPYVTVYVLMMVVLTLASPFFIVFGALSDRIGRRNIMTLGFLLAAVGYWPAFNAMSDFKDNPFVLGVLIFSMVILVTMVYGPLAALLVELFPARIRCTALSLPYQIGNGMFGGLVPLAGAALATALGGPLFGLIYPIAITAVGVIVSVRLRPRTHDVRIWDEVGAPRQVPDQP